MQAAQHRAGAQAFTRNLEELYLSAWTRRPMTNQPLISDD